jgi:hypothetical protein
MHRRLRPLVASFPVAVALAACSGAPSGGPSPGTSASPSATSASVSGATPSNGSDPTAGASTTPSTTPPAADRPVRRLDFGGHRILPGHTVVAYYGAPGGSALGVLGQRSPAAEWSHVLTASQPFANPYRPAVPAYELITDVEQGSPGPHHDYIRRLPPSTVRGYLRVVHRHHGLLILDIQPGRDQFLPLAHRLRRWLLDPDVSLALDPEWRLHGNEVPDRQIGHTDAHAVNRVSAWLSRLVARHHLPQKLLVVHQFTAHEIKGYGAVRHRSRVAVVFNMDGFGPPAVKLGSYGIVRRQHRGFPLGFKLFYRQDQHMFSPRRTLSLHPAPQLVEYE